MEDTDLIARVYPVLDITRNALSAIQESSLHVAPRQHSIATNISTLDTLPCIEIRFSAIPESSNGRIFGCNAACDVVLPPLTGVGQRHFSLNFDDKRRLIVKDFGSVAGTEVIYDTQGHGKRSNFSWLVGGDDIPQKKTKITITVHQTIKFRIVTVPHNTSSQAYIDKVDRFRNGKGTTEDLLARLACQQGLETKPATGKHTPLSAEGIYLKKEVGKGGFGVVHHCWNVSNGNEHALKEPHEQKIVNKSFKMREWEKEARILSELDHDNIVRFIDFKPKPHPQLLLEYLPGGVLANLENISAVECVSILRQCLSALEYLHGRNPPIAHRDIKPGNILVKSRGSDKIHVKFGDFGLSKESDLSTMCGTWSYVAPEVYEKREYKASGGTERRTYTEAVDIWALGVVGCWMVCDIPAYEAEYQNWGTAWCSLIVETLRKSHLVRPTKLKEFLLDAMVVISPGSRDSAKGCSARLASLLQPSPADDGCETPRPASYSDKDDDQKTLRPVEHVADVGGAEVAHAIEGSAAHESSGSSIEPRRARSDATPPPSHPPPARTNLPPLLTHLSTASTGQKRPPIVSPSLSEGRHSKRPDLRSKDMEPTPGQQPEASGSPTNQPVDDVSSQALQVNDPPPGSPSDSQAGQSELDKEEVAAATEALLNALDRPRR